MWFPGRAARSKAAEEDNWQGYHLPDKKLRCNFLVTSPQGSVPKLSGMRSGERGPHFTGAAMWRIRKETSRLGVTRVHPSSETHLRDGHESQGPSRSWWATWQSSCPLLWKANDKCAILSPSAGNESWQTAVSVPQRCHWPPHLPPRNKTTTQKTWQRMDFAELPSLKLGLQQGSSETPGTCSFLVRQAWGFL